MYSFFAPWYHTKITSISTDEFLQGYTTTAGSTSTHSSWNDTGLEDIHQLYNVVTAFLALAFAMEFLLFMILLFRIMASCLPLKFKLAVKACGNKMKKFILIFGILYFAFIFIPWPVYYNLHPARYQDDFPANCGIYVNSNDKSQNICNDFMGDNQVYYPDKGWIVALVAWILALIQTVLVVVYSFQVIKKGYQKL